MYVQSVVFLFAVYFHFVNTSYSHLTTTSLFSIIRAFVVDYWFDINNTRMDRSFWFRYAIPYRSICFRIRYAFIGNKSWNIHR